MSTPPPAVSGTTSLIGRLGQASCADARPHHAPTSASAPSERAKSRNTIACPPGRPRSIDFAGYARRLLACGMDVIAGLDRQSILLPNAPDFHEENAPAGRGRRSGEETNVPAET